MEYAYKSGPNTNANALQVKHYTQNDKKIQKKTNKPLLIKCFICEGHYKTKSCPKNPNSKKNVVKGTIVAMATTGNQGE